ncbi:MAG: phasin family protein [Pseudomonadota bacterium]
MNDFTENFDKIADFASQGLEPVRQFANTVVDAGEELARKNYALCGDMMEFAISQARLPLNVTDPKELVERQVAATKSFAELMNERATEYADMGKAFQKAAAEAANVDFANFHLDEKVVKAPRKRASRAKAA